jgi:hypothetical protein
MKQNSSSDHHKIVFQTKSPEQKRMQLNLDYFTEKTNVGICNQKTNVGICNQKTNVGICNQKTNVGICNQ